MTRAIVIFALFATIPAIGKAVANAAHDQVNLNQTETTK